MEIISFTYPDIKPIEERIILCLGYFDGVHLGHQSLIRKASYEGYKVGVLTFDNSPAYVLGKIKENHYLTSISDKAEYLQELDVDYLFLMHFDIETSKLTREDFVENILKVINPVKLYCGEDYLFGKEHLGTPEYLKEHFTVEVAPLLKLNDKKVASRDIVKYIEEGEMEKASEILSRPYRINGLVVEGKHNGKKIDFPTANLELDYPYVFPKTGVYIGRAEMYGSKYNAIISVGTHPTVMQLMKPIIEVHILDYDGNLYGKDIFVEFIKYIRDEKIFSSLEELKAQLNKDEKVARKFFE